MEELRNSHFPLARQIQELRDLRALFLAARSFDQQLVALLKGPSEVVVLELLFNAFGHRFDVVVRLGICAQASCPFALGRP